MTNDQPAPQQPVAAGGNTMPNLTVPQWLAFAAFLVCVALAFVVEGRVTTAEYEEVRKLAVFLIAALLPSDAAIRFGRALFLRGQADDPNASTTAASPAKEMPRATLPQILAFVTFAVVAILTILSDKVISSNEFAELNDVASFLIAALLPSEAAIRFGRALYLSRAPSVSNAHLKLI